MNLKTQKLLLASSLFIVAGAASATDPAGYYGGISIGRSNIGPESGVLDSNLSAAQSLPGDVSGSIDRKDTGYKLRLGYDLGNGLAVEGGYIDFGKANYSGTSASTSNAASGSIKAQGVNVDLIGKLPLAQNVSVFGKAGLLFSSLNTEASVNGVSISDTAHRVVPGIGVGVDYSLTRTVALRTEYERYYRLGNDSTGKGDADLISVGANVRF